MFELKFEDSNLAGIGSELDENLRKSAAEAETEFDGAGESPGTEIWRIEKFEAKRLPESDHGQFYSGDAYIVLHTYTLPDSDTLAWNLHFFLGKDSTQDERGSAAYFTVNLDDKLNGGPVQFREVQGSESKKFLSLFPVYRTMDGGVASGFKSVEPETYEPRLLHIFGPSGAVRVAQVPLACESLNKNDVFILDAGLKLYQWNPEGSSPFERMRASSVREKIQAERDGEPSETILEADELDGCDEFWAVLGDKGDIAEESSASAAAEEEDDDAPAARRLFTVSDESGEMEVTLTDKGETVSRDNLSPDDVTVVVSEKGSKSVVYLYAGAGAGTSEKFFMTFSADRILRAADVSPETQTVIVSAKAADPGFDACFA